MSFKVSFTSNKVIIKFYGKLDWTLEKRVLKDLSDVILDSEGYITLDFSDAQSADFIFCMFLCRLLDGRSFEIVNSNAQIKEMFVMLSSNLENLKEAQPNHHFSFNGLFSRFFVFLGKKVIDIIDGSLNFLQFCGACLWYFFRSLISPSRFQYNSIFYHINESGFKALPVALLTAFIVSYAIALQGVLQLERMGVPLMSVEIVSKLSLREMGPFILAIVIAGRSSSSFSAQIGVMNLTEENNALKTMNLSLYDYLILPRILALVIVMPLLVFVADAVSLFASMLAINMQTGINFVQYLERFYEYVGINNFWVGVIKAPFFGAAIALVGCFRGLYVKGDTESIGLETTKSVVNAIFWVILINAIFSIITTRLDV